MTTKTGTAEMTTTATKAEIVAELTASLPQFSGTEDYHQWSILCRKHVLTDGAKYLAETAGAYWLMDAIASYHGKMMRHADDRLRAIQFWRLKVNQAERTAVLTCVADSGEKAVVCQRIPYTDFPLDEIRLYVVAQQVGRDVFFVVMLPSEY